MENTNKLFIHKYQPLVLNDFGGDTEIVEFLKTLITMDDLNILFNSFDNANKNLLFSSWLSRVYSL